MRLVIIDNYDSFTYNLYQVLGQILQEKNPENSLEIIRNDELSLNELVAKKYDKIVISPGPGSPDELKYFGICGDVITKIGKTTPVLGVCLGMQGICHFFGGKVVSANSKLHGKTSQILHSSNGIFKNLPQNLKVMRYHSLVADLKTLPDCLEVTAISFDSANTDLNITLELVNQNRRDLKNIEIMALKHKELPIEGMQFHPESFATENGKEMLANFLSS